MFRAAVVSIVMALAAGSNASLLCSMWCHEAEAAGCEHRETSGGQTIAATDVCPMSGGTSTAYVREDVRSGSLTPQAEHARNVTPFDSGPPPVDAVSVSFTGPCPSRAAKPLVLSLRI